MFTEEERDHLSYLGPALSRPNTVLEDLLERMLEAEEKGLIRPAKRQKYDHRQPRQLF